MPATGYQRTGRFEQAIWLIKGKKTQDIIGGSREKNEKGTEQETK